MAGSQRPGLLRTAAIATVAAVILVVIVYFVATWTGDDLVVAPEFGSGAAKHLPFGVAIGATVIGGIVGALFAMLARRFTPRPRLSFIAASTLGLLLYGIFAFARAEATSTVIWLNAMHISAAVPIVEALGRWLPDRRNSTARGRMRLEMTSDNPQAQPMIESSAGIGQQ